jgi:methionyl-tRNA formyltransferase
MHSKREQGSTGMTTVLFMGTPDFAVTTLEQLHRQFAVIGVVTQPDRPVGRNQVMTSPPVKRFALDHGLPVYQPVSLRKPGALEKLLDWLPQVPDFFVVAAFGQILPQAVLDIPKYGSYNVHASLLPRWRGAAPIQAAILHGDATTGVTIMRMDAGLDTGPMVCAVSTPIAPDETSQTLHDRLAGLGADAIGPALEGIRDGTLKPIPQDDRLATVAPQIRKQDGVIDWYQPAVAIDRQVRALSPWPGTFTSWEGKSLTIQSGYGSDGAAAPGEVIRSGASIAVGTGEGLYCIGMLKLAGRAAMDAAAFVRGYPAFVGARLGHTVN